MAPPQTNHAKGLLLTAIGGLTLTVDIPLIKLAAGESWSILLVRSGATFLAALAIWLAWRAFSGRSVPPLIPGRAGLAVAALYGLSSLTFITAVFTTTTANLVFILAFNPMFAALLSWAVLGERPKPATFLAMAAMIGGVGIIVSDSVGSGNLFGDLMAGCSALFIASAITITRATGKDMGFTSLLAVLLPFLLALWMVGHNGFRIDHPGWILFNGLVIMPLSFFCLATGPKYISGPEVAMFYLLETVLAPVWVWLIFAEEPTPRSLAGGIILIAALATHSLWQIRDGRRRRAARVLRHPA